MSSEYTMFGYDEMRNPVVAANVTPPQAKAFAEAKGLTGFFLAPQHPEPGLKADLLTYKREENGYVKWNLRSWTMTHHLDPEVGSV